MANNNSITYKEIFPLIKDNKLWLGYSANKTMEFQVPSTYKFVEGKYRKDDEGNYFIKVPAISWFTNLEHSKRNEEMILYREFNEIDYPRYDNYLAWNVDKVVDIPQDDEIIVKVDADELAKYKEIYSDLEVLGNNKVKIKRPIFGVPITFLNSYNPEQFEVVGLGTTRELYTPIKTYIKPKKFFTDGRMVNANEINSTLVYPICDNQIKTVYYTAENSKMKLFQPYARILIRKK